MMEAVSTSEMSADFYELHCATSQKTVIFILAAAENLKSHLTGKKDLMYSTA
jgi:hypothetical protein